MDAHVLDTLDYHKLREVVARFALTPLGRGAAAALSPLSDRDAVVTALRETEEMRLLLREGARLPLAGVEDVGALIAKAHDASRALEPEELRAVLAVLQAACSIRERFLAPASAARFPAVAALVGGLADLVDLRARLGEAIDERNKVRDEASDRLRSLRRAIEGLRETLRRRVTALLKTRRWARFLQEPTVAIRDDRYVISVRAECRGAIPGVVHARSQSGATLYVEPEEILADGNELAGLLEDERREVARILFALTKAVFDRREEIEAVAGRIARIELAWAKARYAEAYGLIAPEIAEDGILRLSDVRHPHLALYAAGENPIAPDRERIAREVVPMTLALGDGFRILVVTGPNTGGKTVALKTAGLVSAMALSGIPVPAAEGTRIPPFRRIFVDIGDEQSIEQNLSTFSSHVIRIVDAVREAGPGDLVLIDELGAGTDPLEGAALGEAILEVLEDRGPLAMITTHLGALKEYAYTHEGAENASMEFDRRTLAPTYWMRIGIPGRSNALDIARRVGMPEAVVARAEERMVKPPGEAEALIERMEHSRRAIEREKRRTEKTGRKIRGLRRDLEEEIEGVRRERETLRAEAEELVDERIRRLRVDLLRHLKEMGDVPKEFRAAVDRMEEALAGILAQTPLGERREAFARSLKPDDYVYVPRLGETCRVIKVHRARREIDVAWGGVPTRISFDDISWVSPPPAAPAE